MAKFQTQLVHGPVDTNDPYGAVVLPIYPATTYAYPTLGTAPQYDYGRSGNPTRHAVEAQLAALEGGQAAFAFASGMAAIHAALAIFQAGDHLVVGKQIYGGTFRLLKEFFARWDLTITAVDTRDLAAVAAAIQPNTKAIYFEPVTNPLLQVTPVAPLARLAHQHGLLTIVDNTFLSPYLAQPLRWGADIVIHSATKYLAGHSEVSAGVVTVKDPTLAQRLYQIQNALGAVLAPAEAHELARGLKTLAIRLDRQLANVTRLQNFLQAQPAVQKIYYPTKVELGREYRAGGGVLSFELVPGVDAAAVVNRLHLFTRAVSLGAVESLVELPSQMSHAELTPAEQAAAGISPGLIRLAVGIEAASDLIADLQQALASQTIRCQEEA